MHWTGSQRAGACAWVMLSWLWAVGAGAQAAPSTLAGSAAADDSEYQRIIAEALEKYADHEFEPARALFARAHALKPSARTFRALGLTDMALDNFGLAEEELRAALVDERTPVTALQRRQLLDLLAWMRENLAVVRLMYAPLHARAAIDQRPVSLGDLLLEPGLHSVTVTAPGFQPRQQQFQLSLTTAPFELKIELVKQAEEPESTRARVAGDDRPSNAWLWVGVPSVLATLTGVGLVTAGLVAISDAEQPGAGEPVERFYERSERGQLFTTLGFGIGGVGLAGLLVATVLKFHEDPGTDEDRGFAYDVSPTHIMVVQRF